MFARHVSRLVETALSDTPVVLLVGARRTGKTTLAQGLIGSRGPLVRYVTFDDATQLAAAAADPVGFIDGFSEPTVIDEIQKAPEVLPAIKMAVDRMGRPGQFLLTGSADVLAVPRVSESLAGRMEILTLWPLAQSELEGTRGDFIDAVFSKRPDFRPPAASAANLLERALRGGYPEAMQRAARRRSDWYRSYLTGVVQRDIRDLAEIEGLREIPNLLGLIAARNAGLLNLASISGEIALARPTVARYFALLKATFLVETLPAWAKSRAKRVVKAPKVLMVDSGLAADLAGITTKSAGRARNEIGHLLEAFALMELVKGAPISKTRPELFHFRTHQGIEVDCILEAPGGKLAGVEVKAAASVSSSDFRSLRLLEDSLADRFHAGVVLYTGAETVKFGRKLWALPMAALWDPAGK